MEPGGAGRACARVKPRRTPRSLPAYPSGKFPAARVQEHFPFHPVRLFPRSWKRSFSPVSAFSPESAVNAGRDGETRIPASADRANFRFVPTRRRSRPFCVPAGKWVCFLPRFL